MELLATIGVAAKELFEYNREMYQFDQEQRLDRDLLRLEMQVKRFSLFREDIRDLVELTVGKMEMYHAVGALSLWFCITWYTEGRIRAPEAPPFILSLYWMSIAGAFVYLLLTVWLSMHASVTSHSIGVRLLTRYVRLPIPGVQQLNALNPRLADFEGQSARNVMRVPFLRGAQEWQNRARGMPPVREHEEGRRAEHYNPMTHRGGVLQMTDLLDKGEVPFHKESEMARAAKRMPGKHVQLFRSLQMKWQCYDAYARVCMSLGMNQVLMSACFYLICATLLEYHSPSLCFALILVFQSCSLAMSFLDVSGVGRCRLLLHWFFGSFFPIVWAALEVTLARNMSAPTREHYGVDIYANKNYRFAAIPFFLIALWMLGLLCLAWPSRDEKTLPRLFRTVLFVDVFALEDDASTAAGSLDGSDQITKTTTSTSVSSMNTSRADPHLTQERAAAADEACYVAEAALRRWEAVPAGTSEASAQGAEVKRLRKSLNVWRKALNNEAARIAGTHGDHDAVSMLEVDTRAWNELSPEEQAQDPWINTLLGPFEHNTLASHYYYDLEGRQFVWEVEEGRDVLTLEDLQTHVLQAEDNVRSVFRGDPPEVTRTASGRELVDDEDTCAEDLTAAGCCCCRLNKKGKPSFVPERLPWFSLSWMTWALVLAWVAEGSFLLLEQLGFVGDVDEPGIHSNGKDVDFVEALAFGDAGLRRLLATAAASTWYFQEESVAWPGGLFYQPESLACLSGPQGALLLGSSEGLHLAPLPSRSSNLTLQLSALAGPPHGAVALCPAQPSTLSGADISCLMGRATAGGISLWQHGREGEARLLPVLGQPWRQMAGAAVPCSDVKDLLLGEQLSESSWCLLLVGWDGLRLPVSAVVLPDGPASVPAATARIAPTFDVPLKWQGEEAERGVLSLHVEPQRSRLWALGATGDLIAWDLRWRQTLGRWQPQWTSTLGTAGSALAGTFGPIALCEDRLHRRLLVLGRHGIAGPQLLQAQLPEAFDAL